MAHKTIKGKTPHLSSALGGGAAVLPAAHRTEHNEKTICLYQGKLLSTVTTTRKDVANFSKHLSYA